MVGNITFFTIFAVFDPLLDNLHFLHLSQAAQSRQPCVNSHQLSQWEALGTSHF